MPINDASERPTGSGSLAPPCQEGLQIKEAAAEGIQGAKSNSPGPEPESLTTISKLPGTAQLISNSIRRLLGEAGRTASSSPTKDRDLNFCAMGLGKKIKAMLDRKEEQLPFIYI